MFVKREAGYKLTLGSDEIMWFEKLYGSRLGREMAGMREGKNNRGFIFQVIMVIISSCGWDA